MMSNNSWWNRFLAAVTLSFAMMSLGTTALATDTPLGEKTPMTGGWRRMVQTDTGTDLVLCYTDTAAAGFEWTVPSNVSAIDYLVVGGGGAGGSNARGCGGGGGGGLKASDTPYAVTAGDVLSILVGKGGTAGTRNGGNGGASSISNDVNEVALALGGGGGGNSGPYPARSGANGGGGRLKCSGAAGTDGGYAGGNGGNITGGGGGGAGGAGGIGSGSTSGAGGTGGLGVTNSITGVAIGYAGGGGGGGADGSTKIGVGKDGGGNGSRDSTSSWATAGVDGLGGGGGGDGHDNGGSQKAGKGGSGTVIIRYTLPANEFRQVHILEYDNENIDCTFTVLGQPVVDGDSIHKDLPILVVATPHVGYEFASVPEGWTFMADTRSLTREFAAGDESFEIVIPAADAVNYDFTLTQSVRGTVSSTKASGTYGSGQLITLTATENTGFYFAGWLINGEKAGWLQSEITFMMDEDKAVEPVFYLMDATHGYDLVADGDTVLVFTNTEEAISYTIPTGVSSIRYLVVGGGGPGGYGNSGGGGGAGGVLANTTPLAVSSGMELAIKVGAGGAAKTSGTNNDGKDSSLTVAGSDPLTAFGGGGGGISSNNAGRDGGCGGGGCGGGGGSALPGFAGGTGSQGGNGGTTTGTKQRGGSGGGGAGDNGETSGTYSQNLGVGGIGIESDITGVSIYYAGGGGGGSYNCSKGGGAGGLGGGGQGGGNFTFGTNGTNGTDGLGGGGGGVGRNGGTPGRGGDGIVIIRYSSAPTYELSWSVEPEDTGAIESNVEQGGVGEGQSIELTATANQGYNFVGWTKNGVDAGTEPTLSFAMPAEAVAVVANFAEAPNVLFSVINTSTNQSYVAMANGEPVYDEGTVASNAQVTVVVTPIEGYGYIQMPDGWSAGDAEGTITRNFLADVDPLVVTIPESEYVMRQISIDTENGRVVGAEDESYRSGTKLTLQAIPEVGYRLAGWFVNGEEAGTDNPLEVTITEDTVVAAAFDEVEIPEQYVRVDWVASTSGGEQYIDTEIGTQDKLRVEFDLKFNAVDKTQYMMGYFLGSNEDAQYVAVVSAGNKWRAGAKDDRSHEYGFSDAAANQRYKVESLFNGATHTLTIGGVSESFTGASGANNTPSHHLYLFSYNLNGDSKIPADATLYSCRMYTDATSSTSGVLAREYLPVYDTTNHKFGLYDTVTGTFKSSASSSEFNGPAISHQLTITSDHATVSGTHEGAVNLVNLGSTVTLSVAPDSGYEFLNWTTNGVVAGTETTLTFTMPNDDVAVVANTFTRTSVTLTINGDSSKLTWRVLVNGEEVGDDNPIYLNMFFTVEATVNQGYEYPAAPSGWNLSEGTISREFKAEAISMTVAIPAPLSKPEAYAWGWSNVVEKVGGGRDCVIAITNVKNTITWKLPNNVRSFDYLLVGGGGAGGSGTKLCGGGGGGGVVTSDTPHVVWPGDTILVKVGAGGAVGNYLGNNGGTSSITIQKAFGLDETVSIGGGGAGAGGNGTVARPGVNGGGGSMGRATGAVGSSGRTGGTASTSKGGGGAGAGEDGGCPAGGAGVMSPITGAEVYYGGGGGGTKGGAGGLGGGGKGGSGGRGSAGVDGLGGGGGGGDAYANKNGGRGGNGIVVIRYPLEDSFFANSIKIESSGEEFAADTVEYGLHENVTEETYVCEAPEEYYDGGDSSTATRRARCLGWTLYHRETGDSDVVRVRSSYEDPNEDESATVCRATFGGDELYLVWDWQVEFKVTLAAITQHPQRDGAQSDVGGGSVSPTSEWFASNTVAQITATADAGKVFWRWTGDAEDVNLLSDQISPRPTARIIKALDLTANFVVIEEGGTCHYKSYNGKKVYGANGVVDFERRDNWDYYPEYPNAKIFIDAPAAGETMIVEVKKPLQCYSLTIGHAAGESETGSVELEIAHKKTNYIFNDVVIHSGHKLTHSNNTRDRDHQDTYRETKFVIDFYVGGDMTIESGAKIDTQSRGFAGPYAAGANNPSVYGSRGIAYESAKLNKVCCHGSFFEPFTPGFANPSYGKDYDSENRYGAGGCVKLTVAGTLTVNGEINAISASVGSHSFGSGGSIWLTCGTLAGGTDGLIDASASGSYYNSPSGGRIALYQTEATDWDAWEGKVSTANRRKDGPATPGTIYRELPDEVIDGKHAGEIIFEGRETSEVAGYTDFPGEDGVDAYEHCKLVIGNGVKVYVSTNNINQIELGQIIKIRDLVFDEKVGKCPGELLIEGVHLKVLGTDESENDFHYNGAGWKNGDYSVYTSGSSPSIRYIPVYNPDDGVTYPGILSWRGRNLFIKVK